MENELKTRQINVQEDNEKRKKNETLEEGIEIEKIEKREDTEEKEEKEEIEEIEEKEEIEEREEKEEIEKIIKLMSYHFGVFRLCIRLSRFDFHFPTSSTGTDSICFSIPLGRVFKYYPVIAHYDFNKDKGRDEVGDRFREDERGKERIEDEEMVREEEIEKGRERGDDRNRKENYDYVNYENNNSDNNNNNNNNGNSNKVHNIDSVNSDTPGLSYLRGPFLSSEKRISEHKNILKSVMGLVHFRFENFDQSCSLANEKNEKKIKNEKVEEVNFEKKIIWKLPKNFDRKNKNERIFRKRDRTFSLDSTDKSNDNNNTPKNSSLFLASNYCAFFPSSSSSFSSSSSSSSSSSPLSSPTFSPFCLRYEISSATISSWCNQNIIAENLKINGSLNIEKGNYVYI